MKFLDEETKRVQIGRQIRAKRLRAAEKQNWKCHWCGIAMCRVKGCPQQVTIDHVIPRHNGGTLRPGNFVAACFKCNSERHPELNRLPYHENPVVATTGEVQSESPFAKLKELVK